MTDTKLLDEKIKASGVKVSFLSEQLGLSRQGFYKKKDNPNAKWRGSEIYVIKDVLRLSEMDAHKIFYPQSTPAGVPDK